MMRVRKLAVLCGLIAGLFCANGASAAANCPWLTTGSAAMVLGGPATAAVQVSDTGEGACTFTRQDSSKSVLKIAVSQKTLESCPADSPKPRGIGNEAALCKARRSSDEVVELVVSRVRNLHFTVSLAIPVDASPGAGLTQEDAVKQIAEQVAGSLF